MLENPKLLIKTDSNGRFAFDVPVGSNVTLVINKWFIRETQVTQTKSLFFPCISSRTM